MILVERLGELARAERWQVEVAGVARTAWTFDRALEDLARLDELGTAWLGFAHPRVTTVHARSDLDGRLVFVTDDDRGPSLAAAAAQLADDPIARERWVVAQVIALAEALAAMAVHQPGFVYRGLVEDRLFVDHTGHARMYAPLGILAKVRPSTRAGPGPEWFDSVWLSPEQVQARPITAASDVFTLASHLAHGLAGHRPFEDADRNMMAAMMQILTQPAHPIPTRAPGLDRVLARAFEKDPAQRYAAPAAFAAALAACIPDARDYDAVISDRLAAWWPDAPRRA